MAVVSGFMRCALLIFNFVFLVCGCIILGVSIWMREQKLILAGIKLDAIMFYGAYLLIAVGSIITVLSFLGCCGALMENKCMLILFSIGLFVILCLQIAAGVLGTVNKSEVEHAINRTIEKQVASLMTDDDFQIVFRAFEVKNKCCGLVNGTEDWGPNANLKKGCVCIPDHVGTKHCPEGSDNMYKRSCRTVILKSLKQYMDIVMGMAFGVAFIEVLGLVFLYHLYHQIQEK